MQSYGTRSRHIGRELREDSYKAMDRCSGRNWQQMSPEAERSALAPMVIVGVFCFAVSLAFLALVWKVNEHKIAKAPTLICLTAPDGTVHAAHDSMANRSHHSRNAFRAIGGAASHIANHSSVSPSGNESATTAGQQEPDRTNTIASTEAGESQNGSAFSQNALSANSDKDAAPAGNGAKLASSDDSLHYSIQSEHQDANTPSNAMLLQWQQHLTQGNSEPAQQAGQQAGQQVMQQSMPQSTQQPIQQGTQPGTQKRSRQAKHLQVIQQNTRQSAKQQKQELAQQHIQRTVIAKGQNKSDRNTGFNQNEIVFNESEHRITAPKLLVKCSDDATLRLDKAGLLTLRSGDAVVDTGKPFLVKVGTARVLVKDSSVVLITLRNGSIKIRNLQEKHSNSAQVFFGNRRFALCAGQELVAASSFDRLGTSVSNDGVKRRNIHTFDLEDGTNIMSAEFNPVNVIKSTPVLKSMIATTSKEENKTFGKVMKMTACLAIVTAGHGQYSSIASTQGAQIASSVTDPAN